MHPSILFKNILSILLMYIQIFVICYFFNTFLIHIGKLIVNIDPLIQVKSLTAGISTLAIHLELILLINVKVKIFKIFLIFSLFLFLLFIMYQSKSKWKHLNHIFFLLSNKNSFSNWNTAFREFKKKIVVSWIVVKL